MHPACLQAHSNGLMSRGDAHSAEGALLLTILCVLNLRQYQFKLNMSIQWNLVPSRNVALG